MTFIVVFPQVVGSPGNGYSTEYESDMTVFVRRDSAIAHGFKTRGSDDFNLGLIDKDGLLVGLDWMDTPVERDPLVMARVRASLGWSE